MSPVNKEKFHINMTAFTNLTVNTRIIGINIIEWKCYCYSFLLHYNVPLFQWVKFWQVFSTAIIKHMGTKAYQDGFD